MSKKKKTGNPLRSEGGVIRVRAEGMVASKRRVSRVKISGPIYSEIGAILEELRARKGVKSYNAEHTQELGAMYVALGEYLMDTPEAAKACPEGLRPYKPLAEGQEPDDLEDEE